jgi:tripartite-type tricarboxylate transporter receptor subunit TctC
MFRMFWTLSAAAWIAFAGAAKAQDWPARPVRIVVPVTPGSAIDIAARVAAEGLRQQLGQAFVVENRAGGAGTIAANIVAKAEPDGYTLLAHSAAHTLTPSVMLNPPYDTAEDFAAVAPLMNSSLFLLVSPAKYKSLPDLVARAKANPGSLNYAVIGEGGATHLVTERFRLRAGIEATPVSYRGTPEAILDVLAGRIDFFFSPITTVLSFLKDGQLLALAVSTQKRSSAMPEAPTTLELGFPNSSFDFWIGLFAPAKTPRAIVDRLNRETQKAVQTPDAAAKFTALGGDPMPAMTPAEWDAWVRRDIRDNAALVKEAGIKPQ